MKRNPFVVVTLWALAPLTVFAQTDVVRICAHENAGFYGRDPSGAPTGLEADLLSNFAASTKRRVVFNDAPSFDTVLTDTEAGRCEIGASTVTVTEARKSRFLFSVPYFPNRVVVVQKKTSGFARPSDLKDQRVALVKGTVSTGLVTQIPDVMPVLVEDDAAAFTALRKGEVDALACDSAVVLHFLALHPDFGMAFLIGERTSFAFILPKTSKLAAPLDSYLKKFVKSGEFPKLLAKYFGESNAEFLASEVQGGGVR